MLVRFRGTLRYIPIPSFNKIGPESPSYAWFIQICKVHTADSSLTATYWVTMSLISLLLPASISQQVMGPRDINFALDFLNNLIQIITVNLLNQNDNPSQQSTPQGSTLFSPQLLVEDNTDNPLFKLPSIKAVWGMENTTIIKLSGE